MYKRQALDFVPADRQGRIDYADLERLLRPETRAIVCTHASNLTGDAVDLALSLIHIWHRLRCL